MSFSLFGGLLLAAALALAGQGTGLLSIFLPVQLYLVNWVAWVNGLGAIPLEGFAIAPSIFILAYIFITVAFIPAAIFILGAGFVFGIVKGSILAFIGAILGATAAFLIARFVARDWIARAISQISFVDAWDDAIARNGLCLVFYLRLSPAASFNIVSYAFGLTKVSLLDFWLGTTGILPNLIMYVYWGAFLKDIVTLGMGETPSYSVISWMIKTLIALSIIAISHYAGKFARGTLKKTFPETEELASDAKTLC